MTQATDTSFAPDISSDVRPGLRERQKLARDEAILEAAFALIVEEGYDALTMESLASRVGISRQTLYNYFASRDEIVLRAILTLMDQGIRTIELIDPSLSPVERLKRIVRWMMESRQEPARAALVKVRHSLVTVKTHPDYLRAFERRTSVLALIVEAAQAAGELRADLPSRLIVQMLHGLITCTTYDDLIDAGQSTLPEVTDAVIGLFFTGLRP